MSSDFEYLNLEPADAELLDRLVDVGFDIQDLSGMSDTDLQRAKVILSKLGLLHAYPVEDASEALIDATFARIDQYEVQQEARMKFSASDIQPARNGFRIRIPDFISIAAVLLIGVSVLAMLYQSNRVHSRSSECANNLAMVGYGLANYALDHNGQIPTTAVATLGALFGGTVPHRTDPHTLVEGGYCDNRNLHCPSCRVGSEGYSYQTQTKAAWDSIRRQGRVLIILSDQNPILERLLAGKQFDPLTPSANHGSLGRNQLQSDGSTTQMMVPPVFGGDLIWILDGKKKGVDIFLTH